MRWKSLFDVFANALSLENITEDRIQWLLWAVICAGALRLWKYLNKWESSVKREILFWVVAVPLMMGVIALASSIKHGSSDAGKPDFKCHIEQVMIGQNHRENNTTTVVIMRLYMWNNGS